MLDRQVPRATRRISEVIPATWERVLLSIEKMEYRTNHFGRALVRRRQENLGIVFPGLRGPYYSEVMHGFEVGAVHVRMSVLIFGTELILRHTRQAMATADCVAGLAAISGSAIDNAAIVLMAAR